MLKQMDLASVVDVLVTADKHHCTQLKTCALDFIARYQFLSSSGTESDNSRRHFVQVIRTDAFKEMTVAAPHLVGEVHEAFGAFADLLQPEQKRSKTTPPS